MIKVSNLTKMYGTRSAITDLNFEIEPGQVVGFLGPNGAGKTTTMKILTGFMPATSGTANVAGYDVFSQNMDVKLNTGYLPETPPLYLEMKVEDFIIFAAKINGIEKSKIPAAVQTALEKTGLIQVRKRIIGNLSKGYRQRVGLAQALVHNPKVLILDEPTVGLDPNQIIEIRELIKSLRGDHTVILSSHILPEVTATCDRIIVINKGKIVAQDSMQELTARLKKGVIYSLEVKQALPAGLSALRAIGGVKDVSQAGNKIVVEIDPSAGELRDKIVEEAVQSKMGVLEFSSERVSLEEIFLQLTTEENLKNTA